jgi:cell wall-associated NlpC family hydrolase
MVGYLLGIFFTLFCLSSSAKASAQSPQQLVRDHAERLVEESEVSYVYGGSTLGEDQSCQACNRCLEELTPLPNERLAKCSVCRQCSIDCSHFVQMVFQRSGLKYSYLTTATMLALSRTSLRQNYQLIDIGSRAAAAQVGDLLVYQGHVVLLTKVSAGGRGDIVHATGGKDIRLPGQGIQRERNIYLANFRGPLLRILRHESLIAAVHRRLRPVSKK